VGPIRSLVAVTVLAGSLAGCAAGLHDETSKERSTPYVGAGAAGALKIRDVAVIPAAASTAPSTPGTDTGQTQGSLTMVIVNDGTAPDNITGVQVGDGGGVTPTDPTTSGTVEPGHTLVFGVPAAPDSTVPANDLSISGLSSPLLPGTTVDVTITFQNAGQVVVHAPVLSAPGS